LWATRSAKKAEPHSARICTAPAESPPIESSTLSISAWQRLRSAPEAGLALSRSKSISAAGVMPNSVK
jgi:hypothetical protein